MYRNTLESEVLRLSTIVQPEISRKTMEAVTKCLSLEELKEFRDVYSQKADGVLPPRPQLFLEKQNKKSDKNTEFRI